MQVIGPASWPLHRTCRPQPGSWLSASGTDPQFFLPPGALPAQLHSPGILPREENTPLALAGTSLAPGSHCSRGRVPSDPDGNSHRLSCRCWADGSTSHCLGSWRGSAKAAPVSRNKISREAAGPSTNWQTWQAGLWGRSGSVVLLRCAATLPATGLLPFEHPKGPCGTGMNTGILVLLQPAWSPASACWDWLCGCSKEGNRPGMAQGAHCIS